jgi:hypothetical protein
MWPPGLSAVPLASCPTLNTSPGPSQHLRWHNLKCQILSKLFVPALNLRDLFYTDREPCASPWVITSSQSDFPIEIGSPLQLNERFESLLTSIMLVWFKAWLHPTTHAGPPIEWSHMDVAAVACLAGTRQRHPWPRSWRCLMASKERELLPARSSLARCSGLSVGEQMLQVCKAAG